MFVTEIAAFIWFTLIGWKAAKKRLDTMDEDEDDDDDDDDDAAMVTMQKI